MPYRDALALQRVLVEDRRAGRIDDTLLLVEHPHVLTLGGRGDGGRSHVLAAPEALTAAGVTTDEPMEAAADPKLAGACAEVAARARRHFEKAQSIMASAPRAAVKAPRLMATAYSLILAGC
jgi:hypothetical protein